jgi:phenylacetic acid degradation operon negative regulatory protein
LNAIDDLLHDFTGRRPVRTGSLIITIFGDAILPRGGAVLLADLIQLLEAFSLNGSQVRTALSRLVAEGWLEAERRGRRSLYRPTETGRHRFTEATRRIYGGPPRSWSGEWHVLLLPHGKYRDELRKDLSWLGFGSLAPGVMLHPLPDAASLASVIDDLPRAARPLVIAGKSAPPGAPALLHELVERCWDLAALAQSYRRFLAQFAPVAASLKRGVKPDPLAALLARLILIHDYRRVLLRDPTLPAALVPADWVGRKAYATAATLYRALAPPAERWIDGHLRGGNGPLPTADSAFHRRFRL